MSSLNPRKIRVGLFIDSRFQAHWLCRAVDLIAHSPTAEIVLLVELADDRHGDGRSNLKRAYVWFGRLLFRAYSALDRRFFGSLPDPLQCQDITPAPGPVHTMRVTWNGGAHDRGFGAGELRAIQEHELDVALWIARSRPSRQLSVLARHGVWSFYFGTERSREDDLAGFWEMALGLPQSASGVMILGETAAQDREIYSSTARTYPYSYCRNRENLLRKSAEFGARAVRNLYLNGALYFRQAATPESARVVAGGTGYPGNLYMSAIIVRLLCRLAARALQKVLYVDQWVLVCTFEPSDQTVGPLQVTLYPPKDRFWADPFPVERDGRFYVFFEELLLATGKGHLAVVEFRRDGSHGEPVRIIERDYHLSYPFVFEWNGVDYMIPETGAKRTIDLYRCVSFPEQWVFDRVLIDNIRAVDATLHQISGCWWMFVNVSPDGVEIFDELHLYHADSPFGPWIPHKRNPVVSDVMRARPAGRLFEHDGRVFRPSQVCAPIYGAGILASSVVTISPDEYLEQEAEGVLRFAGGNVSGVHTYNTAGPLHVTDRFLRRFRFW